MAFLGFFLCFILGALVVLAVEGLALYFAIFWLRRKVAARPEPQREPIDLDAEQWLTSACNKQGVVWFLERENVPKVSFDESQAGGHKELRTKKGTVQVQPVKKYAKIKERLLTLSGPDGSQATIKLLDYTILAVSSSNLSLKKWAKRYPIRLESKTSPVHDGSKTFYLFFDTSWEKESWCKALRLASYDNKLIDWYGQLSKEFNHYLASLNAEFPSFLKPSTLSGERVEKTVRIDGSSSYSKARIFLKKITKKASKSGIENRENSVLPSRDFKRTAERLVTLNDVTTTAEGSVKSSLEDKSSSSSFQDLVQLGNKGLHPTISDTVCDDKFLGDDGTLCLNLLLSRLFFDAKKSAEINSLVKMRIQKTLSNMRTPSYIGGVTCANLDLGNLPPHIHKIRVLPMDLTEVWAVEVDIEYLGGLVLDIETRIEVCEPELQEELINASSESINNGETSSLLEGIEHYSNQLNVSARLADQSEKSDEEDEVDFLKQSKSLTQLPVSKSKWKTILHTIAQQVSQVPLSLAIRITSLRGTLRFHIRPPPSDQLWFGFTSMPDIDWQLESSVGERKITSSHIALLISNRFKAAVRDNVVLPNCENICIPWMLAEKDDWVPQKVAPFVWVNQESVDGSASGVDLTGKTKLSTGSGAKSAFVHSPDDKTEEVKDVVHAQKVRADPVPKSVSPQAENGASRSVSSGNALHGDASHGCLHQPSQNSTNDELLAPLLGTGGIRDSSSLSSVDYSRTSTMDEQPSGTSEEDKAKRMGRRARMMDLGKKMGEKLEEKRRHIEEKSRHIVEKMRENSRS